jgi:DNA-binding response OmpR family regulator
VTRANILVVEDDRDIRESVTEVLQERGYSVLEAGDGAQALRVLSEAAPKPDLILLDLMMPNMSGFQFRQEQLKNSEHAAIPVAIITADSHAGEKVEDMRVAGLLRKPLKIQPLLDLVERLLSRGPR